MQILSVNLIFREKYLRGLVLKVNARKSFEAAKEKLRALREIFTPDKKLFENSNRPSVDEFWQEQWIGLLNTYAKRFY